MVNVYKKVVATPVKKIGIAFDVDNFVVFEESETAGEYCHLTIGYAGRDFFNAVNIAYKHMVFKKLSTKSSKQGMGLEEICKVIEQTKKDIAKLVENAVM